MKHLKLFKTNADFESATLDLPNISYVNESATVIFLKPDPANGYEYVDFGLPSGTLWAKYNIGSNTEEGYGLRFAWGDTQGHTDEEFVNGEYVFNPEDYVFGTSPYTKYNSEDGLTVLELQDDAANANMGGEWHLPTANQWQELLDNTYQSYVTINNVPCVKVYSKTDSTKYIMIPYGAGYYVSGEHYDTKTSFYLIRDFRGSDNNFVLLLLGKYMESIGSGLDRNRGYSARGVLG